ncbi:MAG: 2-oxo acid dehydrogenase subunit E2 [Synechococcaceae cyanobacterium SM2_3_2]|nr:2-oxo acid dehydrogenase subunit E2 [Synechococcaceae cyanobacterium SM2_3_2]
MIHEVSMPALSSTMETGKIVSWLKSPGDKVEKGDNILVVESDKADMDVESFHSGILAAIVVPEGGTAAVGSAIALLAETEADVEKAKKKAASLQSSVAAAPAKPEPAPDAAVAAPVTPKPEAPKSTTPAVTSVPARAPGERVAASPLAKRRAAELGLDLVLIAGTGPEGRIVEADVERAAAQGSAKLGLTPVSTSTAPSQNAPAPVAVAAPRETRLEPLTTLQSAVVRNMTVSLSVPVFRVGYTITTTALDALYKQVKPKGVTMTALLAKAVAHTLEHHPILNAAYSEQGILYKGDINVAVAVAMEDGGLITPVLAGADRVDLYELSRRWKDLVDRARRKQLQPDEYSSGTFTISNLGMFGVDRFDAILPPNQGAILAVGASQPTVIAQKDGSLAVRTQMQVNMTCDHRVIYGSHAAAFLKDLADLIEHKVESLTL